MSLAFLGGRAGFCRMADFMYRPTEKIREPYLEKRGLGNCVRGASDSWVTGFLEFRELGG